MNHDLHAPGPSFPQTPPDSLNKYRDTYDRPFADYMQRKSETLPSSPGDKGSMRVATPQETYDYFVNRFNSFKP